MVLVCRSDMVDVGCRLRLPGPSSLDRGSRPSIRTTGTEVCLGNALSAMSLMTNRGSLFCDSVCPLTVKDCAALAKL